ncbi:MAG: lysine--tRNA ligase [Patescibacteria group bacterium]|nr:lysine--tRNA ligase [Patescibacteria group bacterium]MBU2508986.1 lysine--tRNA ligase [Patescibacteria group bacterium]
MNTPVPEESEIRQQKLEALKKAGVDPYPSLGTRTATCAQVLDSFDKWQKAKKKITLIGRLMTTRVHGGLIFADLKDETGRLQILLKQDEMDEKLFQIFNDCIDPADFVEVAGILFTTKRGEKTLQVKNWKIVSKALLPLPEKWHGLSDIEQRFRKRYLDLIMNDDVRERMEARSKIISSIRNLMEARGFIEVETPTLQPVYGGGFARPFSTHHNALDADFFLRISDEMYLKRLLVGGFEKVYEITKVFRNEGVDRDHNPEFTMFEAQIAYEDYKYGMDLFEEIFENAANTVTGGTKIKHEDVTVDLKRPWKRMSLVESVQKLGGLKVDLWKDIEQAKKELGKHIDKSKKQELDRMNTLGEVLALAFEELVEEQLIQPTIIFDYPVEVSPLAKRSKDPQFAERFEAFALGSEIGNNYSELNDPVDLEQRFVEEKKKTEAGFEEAHQVDYAYLEAIKHGMPPSCGLGIGIDRMVMLLTGAKNIKEVILFPTLRPESRETE